MNEFFLLDRVVFNIIHQEIETVEVIVYIQTLIKTESIAGALDINRLGVGEYGFETNSFIAGFLLIGRFCTLGQQMLLIQNHAC